jgi:hypothetical protein
VAGDARRSGGERHDKRRGTDAGDYSEDDDRNDDAKPTPEEAEKSGSIYPCTALAVFKVLESFRGGVSPSPTPAVVGAVDGGRRGRRHEWRDNDDNQLIGGPRPAPCRDAVEDGGCNGVLR